MRSRRLLLIAVASVCSVSSAALIACTDPRAPAQPPATQPAPPTPAPPAPPAPPARGGINDKRDRIAEITAGLVAQTHGLAQWRTHAALQADVKMTFGEQSLEGLLTFQINGQGIRLQLTDGTTIGTDGKATWVSPAPSTMPIADATRLLHTFKMFAAAPVLVDDPGMKRVFYRSMHFMGQPSDTFKLGLNEGTIAAAVHGEWCMAYANQRSHQLEALANVSLPFTVAADADGRTPTHVVVYGEMQKMEEVTLPSTWTVCAWTEAAGVKGQALGTGAASKMQFVRPEQALFDRPQGARTAHPAAPAEPRKPQ